MYLELQIVSNRDIVIISLGKTVKWHSAYEEIAALYKRGATFICIRLRTKRSGRKGVTS